MPIIGLPRLSFFDFNLTSRMRKSHGKTIFYSQKQLIIICLDFFFLPLLLLHNLLPPQKLPLQTLITGKEILMILLLSVINCPQISAPVKVERSALDGGLQQFMEDHAAQHVSQTFILTFALTSNNRDTDSVAIYDKQAWEIHQRVTVKYFYLEMYLSLWLLLEWLLKTPVSRREDMRDSSPHLQ